MLAFKIVESLQRILHEVKSTFEKFFIWFKSNHLKVNHEKCYLLLSSKNPIKATEGTLIKSSKIETMLGLQLTQNFKNHILNICYKIRRKLCALGCIASSISFQKRRMLSSITVH